MRAQTYCDILIKLEASQGVGCVIEGIWRRFTLLNLSSDQSSLYMPLASLKHILYDIVLVLTALEMT